jgi:hypothetical protein
MGLMFPKKPVGRVRGGHHGGRYENKLHMKEMRDEMSCSLAGRCECEGPVEIHHLLKVWIGVRGMGRKADDRNTLPLCSGHHRELHGKYGDEDKFFEDKTGYPEFGRRWAEELWINSSYWEEVL